jgi:hypothetical protein
MRPGLLRAVAVAAALVACAAGLRSAGALAGPDDDAAKFEEAATKAKPLLDAARTAKAAETPEIAKGVRAAIDALAPFVKAKKGDPSFAAGWNEALSLGHFHGVKPAAEYVSEPTDMGSHPIRFGLPKGRGWAFTPRRPGPDDQLWGEIRKTVAGARLCRHVKVWVYDWDSTYSDVGGENAKGLAKMDLETDRYVSTKIISRSTRVTMVRLNKEFPQAAFYELVGEDPELGPVRRRNYYVKGKTRTYNFEVIELRKTEATDSPFVAWQCAAETSETDAILESITDTSDLKK